MLLPIILGKQQTLALIVLVFLLAVELLILTLSRFRNTHFQYCKSLHRRYWNFIFRMAPDFFKIYALDNTLIGPVFHQSLVLHLLP
jgi:hypothetical protein